MTETTKTCNACKADVEIWNERCKGCGFRLVLEPEERVKARYLRRPSIGALFWTQGWALGARLYLLFALSLIPVVGIIALIVGTLFGRRWSWKYGGWSDWQSFVERMKLMDIVAIIWIIGLAVGYAYLRYVQYGVG